MEDLVKKLIEKHEGKDLSVYNDQKGNPTIGAGVNLNTPEGREMLRKVQEDSRAQAEQGLAALSYAGGDPTMEQIIQLNKQKEEQQQQPSMMMPRSPTSISEDEYQRLTDMAVKQKVADYNKIKQQRFPNAQLTPEQDAVLANLVYQSNKLIGPNLTKSLQSGDKLAAAREILLRSNPQMEGGVGKRRLSEAASFTGNAFPQLMQSLGKDEKEYLRTVINNIKNPNERQQVLEKYKQYLSTPSTTVP